MIVTTKFNATQWEWTLFITRLRLLFYFVFCTHSICFLTTYQLQMMLGVKAFLNTYFNVLYRSYRVNNKVIDVLYTLMYYYTGILVVVLREGGFCTQVYLQAICCDAHKRSENNKLLWECCISNSTSIGVVFRSLKTKGG